MSLPGATGRSPHAAAAPTRQATSNSETSTMRGHIVATTTPTTRTILRWQNHRSVRADRAHAPAPPLGRRTLDLVQPSDVAALIVAKREQGLSPSTVRTISTVLRGALDVAVRDGLLRRKFAAG